MRVQVAIPLDELTEKQLTVQIVDLVKQLAWIRYHTYRSERSTSGFPDEVLVRERVVYLELKTERGRVSDTQKHWLRALLDAGADAYLVRPRHLELLALILAARAPAGAFKRHDNQARDAAARLREQTRKEIT